MRGILVDINIQGQMEKVRRMLESFEWCELWESLDVEFLNFADVGLAQEATDAEVWRLCQQQELVLVTANRNEDGPDSLGVTIRTESSPNSLPVLTIGDHEELRINQSYARRVTKKVLETLFDIEKLRGTGRLFAP